MVHISQLPCEIVGQILSNVVEVQQREGVKFSYGLSHLPPCRDSSVSTKPQKYVRGDLPVYQLKWDAVENIRLVCSNWHEWALEYALHDVYVKLWRGGQKWFDLTTERSKYPLYEMVQYPKGETARRDPYSTLKNTVALVEQVPLAADFIKRFWFNGLITPETDALLWRVIRACSTLQVVTLPWTLLRHSTPSDWAALLAAETNTPLRSLELVMNVPSSAERALIDSVPVCSALGSPTVSFGKLTRLKLFGSTNVLPITDTDLYAIARTAESIEELTLTCVNNVTIDGVMAIVRASKKTLKVLEYSPRELNGFAHPNPGRMSDDTHVCEILAQCPKLKDLSVSLPTMCSALFANTRVLWKGECQVRAWGLCRGSTGNKSSKELALHDLLGKARKLMNVRRSGFRPEQLSIELFYGGMIFDPHMWHVHGDFEEAFNYSGGTWPLGRQESLKGPYGSSGVYEKLDEDYHWHTIEEETLFSGVGRGLVRV